jgi:hypothetical protein
VAPLDGGIWLAVVLRSLRAGHPVMLMPDAIEETVRLPAERRFLAHDQKVRHDPDKLARALVDLVPLQEEALHV